MKKKSPKPKPNPKPQYLVFYLPVLANAGVVPNPDIFKKWADGKFRFMRTAKKYIASRISLYDELPEEFEVWLSHKGKLLWKVSHDEGASQDV